MAYPATIPTLTNVLDVDANNAGGTDVNATLLNSYGTNITAIQTELGVNPAGSYDTVVLRLAAIDTTVGTYLPVDGSAAMEGALDLDGNDLLLDTDGDSYLHESADDVIDLVLAGASGEFGITINAAEDFKFTANTFTVLAGSAIVMGEACTLGQAAGPLLTFDDGNNYLEITGCNVGIGTAAPGAQIEIVKAAAVATATISCYHDTEATAPTLTLRKADNTEASPALVDDNAVLGVISFDGHDGSGWHTGAKIEARIDGAPSDGTDMPAELTFWTTPDASATALERMVIGPTGAVTIAQTLVIGSAPDYTATNVTPDRAFDADTVAVAELADIVGTLIADMITMGLLQ